MAPGTSSVNCSSKIKRRNKTQRRSAATNPQTPPPRSREEALTIILNERVVDLISPKVDPDRWYQITRGRVRKASRRLQEIVRLNDDEETEKLIDIDDERDVARRKRRHVEDARRQIMQHHKEHVLWFEFPHSEWKPELESFTGHGLSEQMDLDPQSDEAESAQATADEIFGPKLVHDEAVG